MSELVLDHEHIRQLLTRQDFFVACPEFNHLQACAAEVQQAAKRCPHCEHDRAVYRNLIDAFFLCVRTLVAAKNTTAIERLKGYVASKKGYRPSALVLYYRQYRGATKIAALRL